MIEDKFQADDAIERISKLEKIISEAQQDFDDFKHHFELKILAAQKIFDEKTKDAREEIALLTEGLRQVAQSQITAKRRSVKLPSGTLSFRKQPPKFLFGDLTEVNAKDPRLINFVKQNAHDYLKVKIEESVDWANFKTKLIADEDKVIFADTGEFLDCLRVQILPDKFTVNLS